jgi:hypothetical protein
MASSERSTWHGWASHHLGSYRIATAPEPNGIGLSEVLGRVTMQVLVGDHRPTIAAAVQCDLDGIPKGSHDVAVPPMR